MGGGGGEGVGLRRIGQRADLADEEAAVIDSSHIPGMGGSLARDVEEVVGVGGLVERDLQVDPTLESGGGLLVFIDTGRASPSMKPVPRSIGPAFTSFAMAEGVKGATVFGEGSSK